MEDGERERRMIVFSGGTALNCVAKALQQLEGEITHVLPVSDDGGSTAEICRVLGGPAVGDIRSRCLRLSDDTTEEARAVNSLLAHRLSPEDASAAKDEWYEIVEGDHHLWNKISEPYKNTIRAFLVHFQANILRQATLTFDFSNGSIGNYFFAGARIFFRSLEAAIFLYSRVSGIPEGSLVLPAVCTEDRLTLGAELRDGTVIRGQNEISHPSVLQSPGSFRRLEGEGGMSTGLSMCVNKDVDLQNPLDSPISRVLYLSYEGMTFEHEIHLQANPRVMSQLQKCNCVVYGMGSLYTSLCPSLILNGVGETIASLNGVHKILLLNGWHDREIHGYTAIDTVNAVCSSLNRKQSESSVNQRTSSSNNGACALDHEASTYITHLLVPRGGSVYSPSSDNPALAELGIKVVEVDSSDPEGNGQFRFDANALVEGIDAIVSGKS